VRVHLKITSDLVQEISIEATGCSIAIASASLMTEMIEGVSLLESEKLLKLTISALSASTKDAWPEELHHIAPLVRMRENPTKVPCSLMGWFALKDAIKNFKSKDGTL
jgi:nitrogen fixation NifU-like protein